MFSLPREKMRTGGYTRLLSKMAKGKQSLPFEIFAEKKEKNKTLYRGVADLTSVKFLVLVLDVQNATVISTPNFHSYSNAKVIKKQVWLKVQYMFFCCPD